MSVVIHAVPKGEQAFLVCSLETEETAVVITTPYPPFGAEVCGAPTWGWRSCRNPTQGGKRCWQHREDA